MSRKKRDSVLKKQLNERAKEHVRFCTISFADAVILQGKSIATLEGADEVQERHIIEANKLVLALRAGTNKLNEIFVAVGSCLVGLGAPFTISESLSSTPKPWLLFTSIATLLVGSVLFAWSFRRV